MSSSTGDYPRPSNVSDYGSDFGDDGEAELSQLLDEIEDRHRAQSLPLVTESIDHHVTTTPRFAIVPVGNSRGKDVVFESREVEYVEGGINLAAVPQQQPQSSIHPTHTSSVKVNLAADSIPDTRTPLQRFRTAPQKPLSVTDLVSPAWCELQYWYSLTRFGRKKRTPAMRQGSAVHKKLEEEVHVAVPVDVQTREDVWGLRIWNVVQGLRTLRVTGMTRELEIWGTLEGEVVNGIVDELSFQCPDAEFEAKYAPDVKKANEVQVPADQSTISEFFKAREGDDANNAKFPPRASQTNRKIYITDVKTRGAAYIPAGASLRPILMQLMLYRKILSDLSSNLVDANAVFARYNLNPTSPFSDSLIAQLGSLDLNFRSDSTESTYAPVESPVDTVVELLTHNSLTELWQLMVEEFQRTMPRGADDISKILRAEFRSQGDGKIIGSKMFVHGEAELDAYVADEMRWWKGEREPKGVDVEEAFKCRICEFAGECSWRKNKIRDAVKKARERGGVQGKSVAGEVE